MLSLHLINLPHSRVLHGIQLVRLGRDGWFDATFTFVDEARLLDAIGLFNEEVRLIGHRSFFGKCGQVPDLRLLKIFQRLGWVDWLSN